MTASKIKEFSYEVRNGRQYFDDPQAREKYIASKPNGYRGIERHRTPYGAKSNEQLGYYWGFLVLEITKELKRLGWTISLGKGETAFERYYTKEDTHEWLKKHCAKIDDDGVYITLSKQDKFLCSKYIDNVLWVAEHWLLMDRKKLEAKRPELKQRTFSSPSSEQGCKEGSL